MGSEKETDITTPNGIKLFRKLMKQEQGDQLETDSTTREDRDQHLLHCIRKLKQKPKKRKT